METHSLLAGYAEQPGIWDEMFYNAGIRPAYQHFVSAIQNLSSDEMAHKDELAKKAVHEPGHHLHRVQQW